MEILGHDILFLIATQLPLNDLLNFCRCNSNIKQLVDRSDLWKYKIMNDFNFNDKEIKYWLSILNSEYLNKIKYKEKKLYIEMNKPVVVLVMSQMCGACQQFKKKMLPELKKELENDPRVKFVILDFPEMGVPINKEGKDYHPELRNGFVKFFPTFLMFPGYLWNNKDSKLKGVAKHDLEKNPNVDYSKASILSWIDNTIKKDPLFTTNTIQTDNSKPMAPKQTDDGKYMVPTYGTYNRYKSTKINNDI